jgi:hypothetical protein
VVTEIAAGNAKDNGDVVGMIYQFNGSSPLRRAVSCGFREPPFQLSRIFSLTRSPLATQVRASHAGRLAQLVACT